MPKKWQQLLPDAEAAGILRREWPDLHALLEKLLAEGQTPAQVLSVLRSCRGLQPYTYVCCEGALRHLVEEGCNAVLADQERRASGE